MRIKKEIYQVFNTESDVIRKKKTKKQFEQYLFDKVLLNNTKWELPETVEELKNTEYKTNLLLDKKAEERNRKTNLELLKASLNSSKRITINSKRETNVLRKLENENSPENIKGVINEYKTDGFKFPTPRRNLNSMTLKKINNILLDKKSLSERGLNQKNKLKEINESQESNKNYNNRKRNYFHINLSSDIKTRMQTSSNFNSTQYYSTSSTLMKNMNKLKNKKADITANNFFPFIKKYNEKNSEIFQRTEAPKTRYQNIFYNDYFINRNNNKTARMAKKFGEYYHKVKTAEDETKEKYISNILYNLRQKKLLNVGKKKCNDTLQRIDADTKMFNLEEILEIEENDLTTKLVKYLNNLKLLLKDYDKKIIINTLEIKKEIKNYKPEYNFKKVLEKHKLFKLISNDNISYGKNVNKLLDNIIQKNKKIKMSEDKDKIEINNIEKDKDKNKSK